MTARLLIGGPANGKIYEVEQGLNCLHIPVMPASPLTWIAERKSVKRPQWYDVTYRTQTVIDGRCQITVMVEQSVGLWDNGKALAHILELSETMPEVMPMMEATE